MPLGHISNSRGAGPYTCCRFLTTLFTASRAGALSEAEARALTNDVTLLRQDPTIVHPRNLPVCPMTGNMTN
jgi:hypothetical protein